MVLLSLDIDGTLEIGDPPGRIGLDRVRLARRLGYLVGSASDRTLSDQTRLWERHGFDVDFVSHKHTLDRIVERFPQATRLVHIGDANADQVYAVQHGFEFHFVDAMPEDGSPGWIF